MLHLDSGAHIVGTISGFHLGDAIDLGGLAFNASSSTLSWTQRTSGANASGTLTVKEGKSSMTLTLVGSYTSGNFSVTSDGHGGTLITDPPITSGRSVAASAGTNSGSSLADTVPGSAATVISGGYELGASGGTGTNSGGDTDRGGFFSGGGMVQLDSQLSQFAGVVSGFDLGDAVDLQSLGFGSSSSAMLWMHQAPGADGGSPARVDERGHIFSLALLGQYAANFSAGSDGHGGAMITDATASGSAAPTPLVVPHS
jgi:hypothetical protein